MKKSIILLAFFSVITFPLISIADGVQCAMQYQVHHQNYAYHSFTESSLKDCLTATQNFLTAEAGSYGACGYVVYADDQCTSTEYQTVNGSYDNCHEHGHIPNEHANFKGINCP